jgi:hypothetical protein
MLHVPCHILGYYFFKYLPFNALFNLFPSSDSTKYAFPDTMLDILYGPSQLGDHLPNL